MRLLALALLGLVVWLAVATTPTVAGCAFLAAAGFWVGVGVGRNLTIRSNGIQMLTTGRHRAFTGRW